MFSVRTDKVVRPLYIVDLPILGTSTMP